VANSVIGLIDCKDKKSLSTEIRPKVTFVTASMNLGGAERQLLLLCNELKSEYLVEIISLDPVGALVLKYKEQWPDLEIIDSTKYSNLLVLSKIRKQMKKNRPDVVITWLYKADVLGGIAARLIGRIPIIWSARNSSIPNFSFLDRLLLKTLSRLLPNWIVANGSPASEFHETMGYPQKKMTIIPNLVSPWTGEIKSKSKLLTNERPVNSLRIGIAARQVSGKGILETISAISDLPTSFPEIALTISGQSSPESEGWRSNGLYADHEVRLMKSDDELAEWFASLDIYLLASTSWESQPNSLIEAISIGCPVLYSSQFKFDFDLSPLHAYDPLRQDGLQRALRAILDQSATELLETTLKSKMYIQDMSDPRKIRNYWSHLITQLIQRKAK
jgi:glycosyltransferase involved in cell wall biosynthesis